MLTTAALVSTQDPPAPQGGAQPTFRTGVNIVRVDVIVADDDGKPVTDLTKEEFEIIEDGRTQTIDLFRHIRIESTRSAAPRPRQVLNRDTEEREAAETTSGCLASCWPITRCAASARARSATRWRLSSASSARTIWSPSWIR